MSLEDLGNERSDSELETSRKEKFDSVALKTLGAFALIVGMSFVGSNYGGTYLDKEVHPNRAEHSEVRNLLGSSTITYFRGGDKVSIEHEKFQGFSESWVYIDENSDGLVDLFYLNGPMPQVFRRDKHYLGNEALFAEADEFFQKEKKILSEKFPNPYVKN